MLEELNIPIEIKNKIKEWLSLDEETKKELEKLILAKNISELTDRFYTDLEFGTGGIRGIMEAGTNRLNKYIIRKVTQGLANYIIKQPNKKEVVVIAYDSRQNSRVFAEETSSVLSGNGIKVFLFDELRPTPELSFAVRVLNAQAGVVITASHNPKEYNGYKVYWEDGAQVVPPHDKNIIAEVNNIKSFSQVKYLDFNEAVRKGYINFLKEDFDAVYLERIKTLSLYDRVDESNLKVVYTPLFGAGYRLVPMALKNIGIKNLILVEGQSKPDGMFPGLKTPNPEEKEALNLAIDIAKKEEADIVLATDPDCDRVGVAVRKNGNEFITLNGNQIASVLIYYVLSRMREKGKLPSNGRVIKTIVTTDLITEIAKSYGIETEEVLTGFKYIGEKMRNYEKENKVYIAGGEESYGYLVGDFVRDKDGVIVSCFIAELSAWAKSNSLSLIQLLEQIYLKYGYYCEDLKNFYFPGKAGLETMLAIMDSFRKNPPEKIANQKVIKIGDMISGELYSFPSKEVLQKYDLPKSNTLIFYLEDGTKIVSRPSGTEPKIKFYFFKNKKIKENISNTISETKKEMDEVINDFTGLIEKFK